MPLQIREAESIADEQAAGQILADFAGTIGKEIVLSHFKSRFSFCFYGLGGSAVLLHIAKLRQLLPAAWLQYLSRHRKLFQFFRLFSIAASIYWSFLSYKIIQMPIAYRRMCLATDLASPLRYYSGPIKRFWVAELDGNIVGCVGMDDRGEKGELRRLATHPAYLRRGIAHSLTTKLLEHAKSVGLSQVFLTTTNRQPAALALYERVGFTQTGRLPMDIFSGGQSVQPGTLSTYLQPSLMVEHRFERDLATL